jgi:hypothetical protein
MHDSENITLIVFLSFFTWSRSRLTNICQWYYLEDKVSHHNSTSIYEPSDHCNLSNETQTKKNGVYQKISEIWTIFEVQEDRSSAKVPTLNDCVCAFMLYPAFVNKRSFFNT